MGFFFKGRYSIFIIALINVQQIGPTWARGISHAGNVDVHFAIVVEISNGHSGFPAIFAPYPSLAGDVLKFPVTFVEVQLVFGLIARKEQVLHAILVKISDGYSSSIIDVFESQDVEGIVVRYFIVEINSGFFQSKFFKKSGLVFAAACQQDQ